MFRQKQFGSHLFAVALILALVAGCKTDVGKPDPPTITPPEETESQVLTLEEARTSYESFLRLRDLVLVEGGQAPERMSSSAAGRALEEFIVDAQDFQARGWRVVGSTSFDSLRVQNSTSTEISFYVCEDIAGTDLVDQAGTSLVEPGRSTRSPWTVNSSVAPDGSLKVTLRDFWAGDNFCD
jgi:hypothetical protein